MHVLIIIELTLLFNHYLCEPQYKQRMRHHQDLLYHNKKIKTYWIANKI
jgi:hypothetical protein